MKKTRFEIEMYVDQIAKDVASAYNIPDDFYGDCYCDEIFHLENHMELRGDIEESLEEVKSIFEAYASAYKESEVE